MEKKYSLPVTKAEFDEFTKNILESYNFPDLPSYRHAIATMILHLDADAISVEKEEIANALYRSQTNQIAFAVIQEIKEQEKAKQEQEQTPKE